MLIALYRSPLNFSRDLLDAASNSLTRIITSVEQLEFLLKGINIETVKISVDEEAILKEADSLCEKFEYAMEDDFNTSDAIAAIFELVRLANVNCTADSSSRFIMEIRDKIVTLSNILGIETVKEEEILPDEIERLIEERQVARKNKDFTKSDQIRDSLLEKGIILEYTREGVKWKRK